MVVTMGANGRLSNLSAREFVAVFDLAVEKEKGRIIGGSTVLEMVDVWAGGEKKIQSHLLMEAEKQRWQQQRPTL
jgi:hypothetical protein